MPTKKTAARATKKVAAKKTAKQAVKKSTAPAKKRTNEARGTKKTSKKKTSAPKGCACKQACAVEEAFWVNNGPVVMSVSELRVAIKGMTAEQYKYHTAREGNDFARWLRDCLHDDTHAVALERAKSKAGALKALASPCCG